jgi:hypothetical protein
MEKKSTYNQIVGEYDVTPPTTLLQISEVPGTDIPFVEGFRDLTPVYPNPARIKRELRYRRLLEDVANDKSWVNTAILDLPPDDDTIRMAKGAADDIWSLQREAKHDRKVLLSFATDQWKGLPPYYIPATSYPGSASSLFSEIQAHMLEETINGGLTWELWDETEVLSYLNERVAKFMVDTDLLRTNAPISVLAGATGADLPNDVLQLRRVTWLDNSMTSPTVLRPLAEFENTYSPPTYLQAYSDNPEQSLHITFHAPPSLDGTLNISYNPYIPIYTVASAIPLPGIFLPYIKYGIMADMLSKEGEANDPQRAEYCEKRWAEGIELANILIGGAK